MAWESSIYFCSDLIGEITPYNSKPAEYSAQPVILYKYGSNFNVEMVDKFAIELFHSDQPQQVSLCIGESIHPRALNSNHLQPSVVQLRVKFI